MGSSGVCSQHTESAHPQAIVNARGLTYRACCARPALATRGHLSLRVQYVCPFLNYVADMWRTTQKSGIGSVRTVVFARAFPLRQERSERDSERLSFARLAVGRGCDPSARAPDAEPSKRLTYTGRMCTVISICLSRCVFTACGGLCRFGEATGVGTDLGFSISRLERN